MAGVVLYTTYYTGSYWSAYYDAIYMYNYMHIDGVSCPEGWNGFIDGYCYKLFTAPKSFIDAESACLDEESHLSSILNANENSFIYRLMSGKTNN